MLVTVLIQTGAGLAGYLHWGSAVQKACCTSAFWGFAGGARDVDWVAGGWGFLVGFLGGFCFVFRFVVVFFGWFVLVWFLVVWLIGYFALMNSQWTDWRQSLPSDT